MRRWLNKHWLYVIAFGVGLILTPVAIRSAYAARGYFAVGGEYLVLPLALLTAMLIDELKTAINVFVASTKDEDMSMAPVDSAIKKDA
jgi:stage V sporulation protein SpoVS